MLVFVFKQKTAYEMRISDWSSDVCSSDLAIAVAAGAGWGSGAGRTHETSSGSNDPPGVSPCTSNSDEGVLLQKRHARDIRSEQRRVRKGGVGACRSRWAPTP